MPLDNLELKTSIVIMDDDFEVCESLKSMLGGHGFDVFVARNKQSVLQLADDHRADLFLLDINMGPGHESEGLEVLEALKEKNPANKVVLFSAYISHDRAKRALAAGAEAYIEKSGVSNYTLPKTLLELAQLPLTTVEEKSESLAEFREELLGAKEFTAEELDQGLKDFQFSGLYGPNGEPLDKEASEYKQIIGRVEDTNEVLFTKIRSAPELMQTLTPRQFEEFVGDLLRKLGFEVSLTPASRDGGFDLYAATNSTLGTFLYLVECKKYDRPNKVGVEVVRSLYGVLESKRATAGMIVTTSLFTKDAQDFQRQLMHKVQLHDYLKIQKWLNLI